MVAWRQPDRFEMSSPTSPVTRPPRTTAARCCAPTATPTCPTASSPRRWAATPTRRADRGGRAPRAVRHGAQPLSPLASVRTCDVDLRQLDLRRRTIAADPTELARTDTRHRSRRRRPDRTRTGRRSRLDAGLHDLAGRHGWPTIDRRRGRRRTPAPSSVGGDPTRGHDCRQHRHGSSVDHRPGLDVACGPTYDSRHDFSDDADGAAARLGSSPATHQDGHDEAARRYDQSPAPDRRRPAHGDPRSRAARSSPVRAAGHESVGQHALAGADRDPGGDRHLVAVIGFSARRCQRASASTAARGQLRPCRRRVAGRSRDVGAAPAPPMTRSRSSTTSGLPATQPARSDESTRSSLNGWRRGDDLLDLGGHGAGCPGSGWVADQRVEGEQRGAALEHVAALEEQRAQHLLEFARARCARPARGPARWRWSATPRRSSVAASRMPNRPNRRSSCLALDRGQAQFGHPLHEPVGGQQQFLGLRVPTGPRPAAAGRPRSRSGSPPSRPAGRPPGPRSARPGARWGRWPAGRRSAGPRPSSRAGRRRSRRPATARRSR